MRGALFKGISFLLVALFASVAPAWAEAPAVFKKCVKCHGQLGKGFTRAAPDLAESHLTPEQFTKQIRKGSKWKTRDMKHPRYRWKKMPSQRNLSDEEIKRLYKYILSKGNL